MFCSNCGKEIAEGVKFCGVCGTPVANSDTVEESSAVQINEEEKREAELSAEETPVYESPAEKPSYQPYVEEPVYQAPVVTPVYQAPIENPVYYPPMAPAPVEPKLGKGKYMWKKAPGGIKATAIVGALVGIACIVVCIAMFGQFAFSSMLEYPILELTDTDIEFDQDMFENEIRNLDAEYDRLEAELKNQPDSKEKKELERELEYADALLCELEYTVETPSIYNLYMLASVLEEVADELDDRVEFDEESIEEAVDVADNIVLVFGAYGLLILLLTLFAVIFRNNFFTVPALILGFAFPFMFSGVLYGVLFVACYIVFFILNIVINSNYRKYKKAYKNAHKKVVA